jgi:hypothetical protein
MRVNKLLIGFIGFIAIIVLGGICAAVAESQSTSFIAHNIDWLAATNNVDWHAAAIAAIPNVKIYMTTKEVATRYGIDPRSVQRRVKMGILPLPVYLGTRYPRWSISSLDANDRKYASVRVENVGAIAALAAKKEKAAAAKPVEDKTEAQAEVAKAKAAKPKIIPTTEKRPRGRPRKAANPTEFEVST